MHNKELLPHLFRTEYRKLVAVLSKLFGLSHIELAEDIVSDTFLLAAETWGIKGLPPNPIAWLYTVSKNKTKDALKHHRIFETKVADELNERTHASYEVDIDLSAENIVDSQLQMMFAICHPSIPQDAQIGLSLQILCGFGVEEIADAFLSTRDSMYKRLQRAKDRLRTEQIDMQWPTATEIDSRMESVLSTLYLLFNEGYYSRSQNTILRKDLCLEAMRLNLMLVEHRSTNTPQANALLSLMCFHASRFDARINSAGEIVLYEDQDTEQWNQELIRKGERYLNNAAQGPQLYKYHLEAAIAYWHTHKLDSHEKWENILQLYNRLLQIEYSPIAALNRTYALSKANSVEEAIREAEKLQLIDNHFYHSLLGHLYSHTNVHQARVHFQQALALAKTQTDKNSISNQLLKLS